MAEVKVSEDVLAGLEAVRMSGLTNMFDRSNVANIAEEMDFIDTAEWIRANRTLYSEGIFKGFTTEGS